MHRFPLLALLGLLTACDPPDAPSGPSAEAHGASDHDAMGHDTTGSSYSDVRFLDHMTAHHRMAVDMARMAAEQAEAPELRQMAQRMIGAQQAEIDSMQAWRTRWFAGEPATPMDAEEQAMMGMGMDMSALQSATGAAFDRTFQQMMIPHHAGAVTMAAEAQMHSERAEVRDLAEAIIAAQAREIGQMQGRLEATSADPIPTE